MDRSDIDLGSSPVEIRVLGRTEVTGLTEPALLSGVLPRTVLGLLVLDLARQVDQDWLQEQLWPDQPPRRKSAQVFSLISNLRRALGEERFPRTRGRYGLAVDPDLVDLHRFERLVEAGHGRIVEDPSRAEALLREALELWRGRPFDDQAEDVDELVEARRSLELKRLHAQRAVLDLTLDAGRHAEALPEIVDRLREHPSEPSFWVARMRAHAGLGDWDAARSVIADAAATYRSLDSPIPESIKEMARRVEDRDIGDQGSDAGPGVAGRAQTGEAPYRGLASFQTEDRDRFFGREALTARLTQRLRADGFLVITGPSGSGKSSLVRAGILATEQEADGVATHLMTPGADPLAALAGWWAPVADRASAAELVRTDPQVAVAEIAACLDRDGDQRAVLVVDQFEEVFSQCPPSERRAFLDTLVALAGSEWAAVALTVRADFVGRCAEHDGLRRLVNRTVQLVGPLSGDELRRAIENPAHQLGLVIEPGLVDRIIADADIAHEPGSLPLVSHALFETWAASPPGTLTHVAYHAAGGVKAAIATSASRVFAHAFTDDEAVEADQLLLELVATQPDGPDLRKPLPLDALAARPAWTAVVSALADARLLTVDGDQVQIAHEALLRRWPRLVDLIRANGDALRFDGRATTDAVDWARSPDPDRLYRGGDLDRLLARANRPGAAPELVPFAAASSIAATRARRFRRLGLACAGLVLVTVLVGVGFAASTYWERAAADRLRRDATGEFVPVGGPDAGVVLHRNEVTNAQYRRCVEAAVCAAPRDRVEVIDGRPRRPFVDGDAEQPVRHVSAREAHRFCRWIDAELPEAADLTAAITAGGTRRFPWGDEPPVDGDLADASVDGRGRAPQPVRVGDDRRPSTEGATHLLGNVAEWTASPFDVVDQAPMAGRWDPDDPSVVALVVLAPNFLERTSPSADRWMSARDLTSITDDLGFRCAR